MSDEEVLGEYLCQHVHAEDDFEAMLPIVVATARELGFAIDDDDDGDE